jgi:exosome complex RNA-binding protein Rrp4
MAKITGTTEDGYLVQMSETEVKRVFATKTPVPGMEVNLNVIYNQLVWLMNNKTKLRTFADALRNSADNLEAAVNTADV